MRNCYHISTSISHTTVTLVTAKKEHRCGRRARAYAHEKICTFTYGQHEGKTRNSAGFWEEEHLLPWYPQELTFNNSLIYRGAKQKEQKNESDEYAGRKKWKRKWKERRGRRKEKERNEWHAKCKWVAHARHTFIWWVWYQAPRRGCSREDALPNVLPHPAHRLCRVWFDDRQTIVDQGNSLHSWLSCDERHLGACATKRLRELKRGLNFSPNFLHHQQGD